MQIVTCANCQIEFGLPDELYKRRKEDGKGFNCPNGHELFFGDSEVVQLKRQVAQLKRQIADRDITISEFRKRVSHLNDQVEHWKRVSNGYKGQWQKALKKMNYQAPIEPPPCDLAHGE
jgi:hypothetical protein